MENKKLTKERMAELWSKGVTISGEQVKRVLETLRWDVETFHTAYKAEIAKGHDKLVAPETEEIKAVMQFQEDGNYDSLMSELRTSHPLVADHTVTRVIRYQHLPH